MTPPVDLKVLRLHPDAILPTRATDGSAGWDLYTRRSTRETREGSTEFIPLGVAVEIPLGYVGLLCLRSGMSTHLSQTNGVGIIDSDYRGELAVRIRAFRDSRIEAGQRVAQLVIVPVLSTRVVEVQELSPTVRGTGGWGSSGV